MQKEVQINVFDVKYLEPTNYQHQVSSPPTNYLAEYLTPTNKCYGVAVTQSNYLIENGHKALVLDSNVHIAQSTP